jgi:hypothetical protein
MSEHIIEPVSLNKKTVVSINFPFGTCDPTSKCKKYCYGKKGLNAMPGPRKFRDKYWEYIANPETDLNNLGARIIKRAKSGMVRWAGVGDMTEPALNLLLRCLLLDQTIIHWVVTRKPSIIKSFNAFNLPKEQSNRLFITFSVDVTKESLYKLEELKRSPLHPRMSFAFVRDELHQVNIPNCSTIYNLHQKKTYLKDNSSSNDYYCPCDTGDIPVDSACIKCQHCFNGDTLRNPLDTSKIDQLIQFIKKEDIANT